MSDPNAPSLAAQLLSAHAHAVRNNLATLRSIRHLIEDAEVAGELDVATSAIQVLLERAITAARVELGERPPSVRITPQELLRHAQRRATREGNHSDVASMDNPGAERSMYVPGTWAERLLADLIHVSIDALSIQHAAIDDEYIEICCTPDPDRWRQLERYVDVLASACAGTVEQHGDTIVLRLPTG